MNAAQARVQRPEPEQQPRPEQSRARVVEERPEWAGPRLVGEPPERDPVTGRRTVTIRGQAPAPRRRSPTAAQFSARPDRVAMWAVVLGLFMVFMAVATARAEPPADAAPAAPVTAAR